MYLTNRNKKHFKGHMVKSTLFGLMVSAGLVLTAPQPVIAKTKTPEIFATTLSANAQKTRFSASLNFAVGYNVYVLQNPYRVVIDIPNAVFDLSPSAGANAKGLIKGFRYGQIDDSRSRIVIDVDGPVLIQNSYAVRAKQNRPAKLIIDLVPTDTKTFAKVHQIDQVANLVAKEQSWAAAKKKRQEIIPIETPPISANSAKRDPIGDILAGKKSKQKVIRNKKAKRKKLIVIDPGHGGVDSGAMSKTGIPEKKIVLAFSRKLKQVLLATGRYDVRLTRNSDKFLPLRTRTKIAHKNKADLFIAVHADSIKYGSVRGTTLYTLSDEASDDEAAELARKENRADIIGGVNLKGETKEVTNILIDLAQRETKNHSIYFARNAVANLRRVTKMAKRPLRAAGFMVLKAPDVPSILIELGYMSNKKDVKLLTSTRWQRKISSALKNSIDNYFRARLALK